MPLILGTNSIKDTGYNVANSLRFNDDDSAYLSRSQVSGDATKFTYSGWFKRSLLSDAQDFLDIYDDNNNRFGFFWSSDDQIDMYNKTGGSTTFQKITTAKFRDVSAWYHVVISADSSLSTAEDRVKLYVNGVRITSFGTNTNISQDASFSIHTSDDTLRVGSYGTGGSHYDGYMAEVVWIDGTAYAQTDFGEFDSDSPTIWKPKSETDISALNFGNNGFYLNFQDSSALGNDVSGQNHDLSVTNLAATDQSTDTCTNNFCTLNSISEHNDSTFSNGNLTYTGNASAVHMALGSIGVTKGKWYFEAQRITGNSAYPFVGVFNTDGTMGSYLGQTVDGWSLLMDAGNNGEWRNNNTLSGTSAGTFANGDTAMVAIDMDNGKIWFGRNGTFADSGNPSAGSGEQYSNLTGTIIPAVAVYTGASISLNFGSPPFAISSGNTDANSYGNFEYAVPSGYYSLNTKNLAEFG
tara:strand:- start:1013 stop:2410 length:1398 start_codon:yes stop_codon:yes gene_type:complete